MFWGCNRMGNEIVEQRKQYVVKSNELIQRTRYKLTLQQQRLLLYTISKIKPGDTPDTEYVLDIPDICDVCGLEIDEGGYYYKAIKDDFEKLTKREWGFLLDGSMATLSWIGDAFMLPLTSTVTVTFNKYMGPYLFELKRRYTQYQLQNILTMRSAQTIRLYEILRSNVTQKDLENGTEREAAFTLKELKERLGVAEKYKRWADFEKRVLKKAVEEINTSVEDIRVDYYTQIKQRSINRIVFIINGAKAKQMLEARIKRSKALNNLD